MDLGFDSDWGDLSPTPGGKRLKEKGSAEHPVQPTAAISRRDLRYTQRRAFSEARLDEVMDWHLEPGETVFLMTGGDVDALSYLRRICKAQRVEYAIVSTWTMSAADAEELASWLDRGIIGRVDFYGSDQMDTLRREAWDTLIDAIPSHGGRLCTAWLHAKVEVVYGDRYDAAVTTSANLNTNTRVEQATVTADTQVADFFRSYYDNLTPVRTWAADGWAPWTRERI